MTEWIETSALVLAKCASNDPWFPNPSQAMVIAWAEIFSTSHLTREDLLAGVTRAYRTEDAGYRPLPASIVKHARAGYFESLADLPDERRESMEDAAHALMEIGIQPPDAHKYVRRIVLGRTPPFQLTTEQDTEFRDILAERQAIKSMPPKPLDVSRAFHRPTPSKASDAQP
ncbi:hypothetical protein C7T36_18340 [Rhodococcus sp. AD45-ID]|uniref:hypothetical protein n=1 Tax=unclassified Rhodococcus (in: high G+C Gram-positive bacteria) TaxID=192944 RepID=UPI0005D2D34C|nr:MULTISPECIES: hypothetical protein [unclassified Rhodococcus (in: high G+C Gram-positive bacteria)]KJF21940.1 hypothetical protein SZ00_02584 [Rhodococcus sp. AD45]PSR39638.1 hypothetical protein C7T36_18340 [Rhodococcus sp. AD45-ID]